MKPIIDLTDKIINGIKIIKQNGRTNFNQVKWLCVCHCGKNFTTMGYGVTSGHTLSCGCSRKKHGDTNTALYRCWKDINQRCTNPKNKFYSHYGGRGISVCNRWKEYQMFKIDMQPTYKKGLSIDRKDNNGNYEPSNCRWATQKQQMRNIRTNVFIDTPWGNITVSEACEISGLDHATLGNRIKKYPPEYWFAPVGSLRSIGQTKKFKASAASKQPSTHSA